MTTTPHQSDDTTIGPPGVRAVRFRWRVGADAWIASDRPVLVGILNVTPDSFSDGGELETAEAVAARAAKLASEGADALDVGGESTRPGAGAVSEDEQIARVVPAVRAIREAGIALPVSVDTTRARVAGAALDAGADAVNDVSGGTDDPSMLRLVAERGAGVVLMHRLTTPARDTYSTAYEREPAYPRGVVREVRDTLEAMVERTLAAGVANESILVDPGLGFGKSVGQNAALLRACREFAALGAGVLVGASRKSFLSASGRATPGERDPASLAAATVAMASGARCFRVHDVRGHRAGLDSVDVLLGNNEGLGVG